MLAVCIRVGLLWGKKKHQCSNQISILTFWERTLKIFVYGQGQWELHCSLICSLKQNPDVLCSRWELARYMIQLQLCFTFADGSNFGLSVSLIQEYLAQCFAFHSMLLLLKWLNNIYLHLGVFTCIYLHQALYCKSVLPVLQVPSVNIPVDITTSQRI